MANFRAVLISYRSDHSDMAALAPHRIRKTERPNGRARSTISYENDIYNIDIVSAGLLLRIAVGES